MNKFLIFPLILLVACTHAEPEKRYSLNYLVGATGYNLYIEDDQGSAKYFYFDEKRSSQSALRAWYGLRWNVLYPNSKGKVRIFGYLDEKEKLFVLASWALESPFTVWYERYPDELSADYDVKIEVKLTCEHFEKGRCPNNLNDFVFER